VIRLPQVGVVWRKEILDLLRDKRTVYGMLVLPIVIYPLLLVLFSQALMSQTQKLRDQKYRMVVVGAANGPGLMERVRKDPSWEVTEAAAAEGLDARVMEGEEQVVLVVPPDFTERLGQLGSAKVELRFNDAKEESIFAKQRAETIVEEYAAEILKERLVGKPEGFERPIDIVATRLAPPEKAGAFHLGRLLAMLLVMMTAVSAFYPSVDMASGEKERGTMETLLVSPALRSEIVMGKFLAVAAIASVTAILHLTSMGLTFSHFFRSTLGAAGINFSLPLANVFLVLLPMVPLVLFFSALCLGLSAFARSYKESMVYLTPIMVVANVTAFTALIPGIEFNYALALIPIQNCAMLTVQLLTGDWRWGHLAATVASSSLYALIALRWTWSIFQREDVLLRGGSEFDWKQWFRTWGSARAGIGHALGGAIAMLALQLMMASTLQDMNARHQMLASQIIVIALPAGVIAAMSALNLRDTFRLRAPRAAHVALAPVLAGAFLILASHLNQFLMRFEFFRTSATEHSNHLTETMQKLGPVPLVLLFLAVLPALCEEFLFRGLVLSGLRRDLGRLPGILATGALFGVVHRVPLAVVTVGLFGIVLSWMALHSGSLLVTILAHATWNAGLIAATHGYLPTWIIAENEAPGAAVTGAAVGAVVAGLWAYRRVKGVEPADPETP
jgi:sodium transport system permease protein